MSNTVPTPVFRHDCERCIYLGQSLTKGKLYDHYVCPSRTWRESECCLARFGSEGSEYESMSMDAKHWDESLAAIGGPRQSVYHCYMPALCKTWAMWKEYLKKNVSPEVNMSAAFDYDEYLNTSDLGERDQRWQQVRIRLPIGEWVWARKLGETLRFIHTYPAKAMTLPPHHPRHGDIVKVSEGGQVVEVVRRIFPQLYCFRYRMMSLITVREAQRQQMERSVKTQLPGTEVYYHVDGLGYVFAQGKAETSEVVRVLSEAEAVWAIWEVGAETKAVYTR